MSDIQVIGDWVNGTPLNINVGDIITGYNAGYYVVTLVEERPVEERPIYVAGLDGSVTQKRSIHRPSPLVSCRQIAKANGQPINGNTIYHWDYQYCRTISISDIEQRRQQEISQINKKYDAVMKLLAAAVEDR